MNTATFFVMDLHCDVLQLAVCQCISFKQQQDLFPLLDLFKDCSEITGNSFNVARSGRQAPHCKFMSSCLRLQLLLLLSFVTLSVENETLGDSALVVSSTQHVCPSVMHLFALVNLPVAQYKPSSSLYQVLHCTFELCIF